jgi:signal transduction histidine kinase/ligand-binding sensor domain-containing protein
MLAPGSSGQQTVPRFDRFSTKDGLFDNDVQSIHQDRSGFIWIGVGLRLHRFDGYAFRTFEGCSPMNIGEDSRGRLWVAGNIQGLFCYDPHTDSFAPSPYKLAEQYVRRVCVDRNDMLWVATSSMLHRIDLKRNTVRQYMPDILPEGEIRCITEGNSDDLWLGYMNWLGRASLLLRFNRKTERYEVFTASDSTNFYDVKIDRNGTVWTASDPPVGFGRVDLATHTIRSVREKGAAVSAKSLSIDVDGKIWIGTLNDGVKLYDPQTQRWVDYHHQSSNPTSISGDYVTTLHRDRSGNIWIATLDGVSKLGHWQKQFSYIPHNTEDSNSPPKGSIQSICEDAQNDIWLASFGGGVVRWNRKKGIFTRFSQFPESAHLIRAGRSGTLWIAGKEIKNILYEYDPSLQTVIKHFQIPNTTGGFPPGIVTAVCEDSAEIVWLGFSQNTLCRWDRRNNKISIFPLDTFQRYGANQPYIKTILHDSQGILWIAAGRFLVMMDPRSGAIRRFWPNPNDSTTIESNFVYSIHEDTKGRVWFGGQGLQIYDRTTKIFRSVHSVVDRFHTSVSGILEDGHGRLWLRADNGLIQYDPTTDRAKSYEIEDGVPPPMQRIGTYYGLLPCAKLRSGEMVFSMLGGIVIFHPDSIRDNPELPPIVFSDFRISDKPVAVGEHSPLHKGLTETDTITLSHDQNDVSFEFSALDYTVPAKNEYAYRLEGFDPEWIQSGSRRFMQYTNLPPGEYRLQVRGSNNDGVWNEAGASLLLIVRPAYWQTWWFRSFALIMFLGFIGFTYRRKVNRLKNDKLIQQDFSRKQIESQEAERKRIASELHDGLGQNLLVVKNEIQQFLSDKYVSKKDLHRVDSMMQESVESVREISSNLHPHHIERLGFCAAVEALTENISHASGLRIECSCDKLDHQMRKETEIHVYRIIQEALSNIIRHASARNAHVEVRNNPKSIDVIIHDDGCGFDIREFRGEQLPKHTDDVSRGFGLASMSERARIIGGTLTIESTGSSGTTIHLTLPLS